MGRLLYTTSEDIFRWLLLIVLLFWDKYISKYLFLVLPLLGGYFFPLLSFHFWMLVEFDVCVLSYGETSLDLMGVVIGGSS